MFTCDLYTGSPPPHDLERLRTTMQRRVDFVRVGYFIPLNGPLNGHPPSGVPMPPVSIPNPNKSTQLYHKPDVLIESIAIGMMSTVAIALPPSPHCCAPSHHGCSVVLQKSRHQASCNSATFDEDIQHIFIVMTVAALNLDYTYLWARGSK